MSFRNELLVKNWPVDLKCSVMLCTVLHFQVESYGHVIKLYFCEYYNHIHTPWISFLCRIKSLRHMLFGTLVQMAMIQLKFYKMLAFSNFCEAKMKSLKSLTGYRYDNDI